MELLLDGRRIASREELHDALQEGLKLPAHYGRNLDALYDCLSECAEETTLVLTHRLELEEAIGAYGRSLVRVLRDAAEENPRFCFSEAEESTDSKTL